MSSNQRSRWELLVSAAPRRFSPVSTTALPPLDILLQAVAEEQATLGRMEIFLLPTVPMLSPRRPLALLNSTSKEVDLRGDPEDTVEAATLCLLQVGSRVTVGPPVSRVRLTSAVA